MARSNTCMHDKEMMMSKTPSVKVVVSNQNWSDETRRLGRSLPFFLLAANGGFVIRSSRP